MAEEFSKAVEDGLNLSKRIYFGKDRAVAPPKPLPAMEKSAEAYLPKAPMVYAVISNPAIVDNPDLPSYQPYVHGRCDPPALIPLQMNRVELEVDCYLDTAVVRLSGTWRVHCVMGSKSCDCCIAIPMGEQGSILGVETEIPRRSYSTELIAMEEKRDGGKEARPENGGYLKSNIFTMIVPKVDGGSNLSIKVSWVQKLLYQEGQFSLVIPFSFPNYVTPAVKLARKERIQLNVDSGTGTEIVCKATSHPLQAIRREVGKLGFLYEKEILTWTSADFAVSYAVPSSHTFGGVLLQSPSVDDADKREMFCVYMFPRQQSTKVFRKEIVFVIDISGSMEGRPLESTKNVLINALTELDSKDSFNIIAFNGETYPFSSSMELATEECIERALEWINANFIAAGGTNILLPLNQAVEMLSNTQDSIPIIFLVTDGSIEDERHICDVMKSRVTGGGLTCPRIYTFGIGSYCNHHFLRMLAILSRGQHDAAYDVDMVESRMQKLLNRASSTIVADITLNTLDDIDVEVYPSRISDLSSNSPLTVSGRYHGAFPDFLKLKGVLADSTSLVIDLKIQTVEDMPFYRVFAKQQIDILTAQAWFTENKELEEKVAKISVQSGIASEYTLMAVLERGNQATDSPIVQKGSMKSDSHKVEPNQRRIYLLQNLCVGFGNVAATAENIPPGNGEPKLPEAAEVLIKAASNCCGSLCNKCCCMCCIQCCSKMNDQCAIVLTQLCSALAFFGCFECCSAICCCDDGN
ncbi:hypothetical protein K2173_016227 [Erythroxylum novogranatense]|uniref:VWFA domain-containing protein n=1 Tax=Erythroxylum novogranatense TaxID=1862640 RepID=A0AAV8SFL9_9ROSI|nr:hypothetical protein K2173_016227 [Erythroxylum novogranatense]